MRIMKKLFLISIMSVSFLSVYSQDRKALTFDEAINITLTNNPAITALKYEEEAAAREKKAATGLRFPNAGITGAYMFMSDDIDIDLNNLKTPVKGIIGTLPTGLLPTQVLEQANALLGKNWNMMIQERSFGSIAANVSVPLFTGGKINAANNAAKIKVRETQETGSQSRNALVSELTERYFGLSLALQVVEVRKQVLEGMKMHLADAKALEANGIIAHSERLYAEVYAAEAERDYQKAIKDVETINTALSNTLNSEELYSPITNMFILNEIESLEHFKEMARINSPLLKQVALKKELAQENIRLQRSEFMPQVAAMGAASLYNYQVSPFIPKWTVGAGVQLKIFDGLTREHKYGAAKSVSRQVGAIEIKATNDIMTLIEKLYNEMITYKEQLPSLNASDKFAREYLRVKEAAFKEGMASSVDVVDAQLNLAKIQTEKLQAAYYYDLMLAKLLEASGQSHLMSEYGKRSSAEQIRFEN